MQPFGTASRANVDCGRTEFDAISQRTPSQPQAPSPSERRSCPPANPFLRNPEPPPASKSRWPLSPWESLLKVLQRQTA